MCGPSQQESQITDEQQQFYQTLSNEYSTMFGENQGIVGALTGAFTPILQAGPSQTGFSPSQLNAEQTANTENVATDYAQAQKATANTLAGLGGGNTLLPSSINANILAANANQMAAQRASGQNQITQADYAQGNQNWLQAASVLGGVGSLTNPTNYATNVTNAGGAASSSAQAMAAQSYAPWGAAIGSLGSVAGLATAKYLK
jgi:hypothetical protein